MIIFSNVIPSGEGQKTYWLELMEVEFRSGLPIILVVQSNNAHINNAHISSLKCKHLILKAVQNQDKIKK